MALFLLYAALWLATFLACVVQGRPVYRAGAFRLAHPVLAIGVLLVLLNGLCPYLGLKTQSSFAMFSNLQTEGDRWNSYVFPKSMRVFGYQDQLVRILDSSDERLARSAVRGDRWVWFEFHRYLHEHPEASVTWVHDGDTRSVERAGDDPAFAAPPHPLLARLFWFRPVRPARRNTCVH